jgi:hypothetical protein
MIFVKTNGYGHGAAAEQYQKEGSDKFPNGFPEMIHIFLLPLYIV